MTETPRMDGPRMDAAPPRPMQVLRRSKDDRVGVGVAGGLGRFFGVDPIIFRVLFVALSFMGLAGVVLYLICYAVIPEEGAANSTLDRVIARLRAKGVPIWLAILGALVLIWVCLLSWWSPVPFSVIFVIAVVVGVGMAIGRKGKGGVPSAPAAPLGSWGSSVPSGAPTPPTPAAPAADWHVPSASEDPTARLDAPVSLTKAGSAPTAALPVWSDPADRDAPTVAWDVSAAPSSPAAPAGEAPLPTASEQLREWWGETQAASASRGRRGWITEAVAYTLLGSVWLILGLVSLGSPIPVQAFLWSGFGIILGCMLIGALLRRPRWRMVVGVLFTTALILIVGNYPVRIGDATGQQTNAPSTVSDVKSTYRMFGGEQLLDLSDVDFDDRVVPVTIIHSVGHVKVTLPPEVDLVLDAKVRFGEILAGDRQAEGAANHIQLTNTGSDGKGGGTLRLQVTMLAGQVEIVRA